MGPINWNNYATKWARAVGLSLKDARRELTEITYGLTDPVHGYPLEMLNVAARAVGSRRDPFPANGLLKKAGRSTHLVLVYG
jgi:hypothetical protein